MREAQAERIRADEAAQSHSKLRAAEEFISYVRQNPLMRRRHAGEVKQITLRSEPKELAFPALEMPRTGPPELNGRHRADPAAAAIIHPVPPVGAVPRLEG